MAEEDKSKLNKQDIRDKLGSLYESGDELIAEKKAEAEKRDHDRELSLDDYLMPHNAGNSSESDDAGDKEAVEPHKDVPKLSLDMADTLTSDEESAPPNIYDIFLRFFYHFQGEWILIVHEGSWHGILSKKTVLKRLSQIQDLKDPLTKELHPEDLFFPTLSRTLEIIFNQQSFPLLDMRGNLYEEISRAAALELVELYQAYQEPVPLLMSAIYARNQDLSQQVKNPANQKNTQKEDSSESFEQQREGQSIDWFISLLLESIPYGLVALDLQGRIIFFNEQFKLKLNDLAEGEGVKILDVMESFEDFILTAHIKKIISDKKKKTDVDTKRKQIEKAFEKPVLWEKYDVVLQLSPIDTKRKIVGILCLVREDSPRN